nr:hypothetical protein [uncultured Mediterranean phage uvMED]
MTDTTKQIVDKMVMVKLNCSYDTGYRHSEQATNIVALDTNCNTNMLKAGVTLYDRGLINSFTAALSRLRTYYQDTTLPWDTKSWRVIPSSKFKEFKDELETLIAECKDRYENVFIDNYDRLKDSFEDRKGDLDLEFPSKEDFSDALVIEYDMGAAASTSDIRIQGIDQQARKELSDSMKKQYESKIKDGVKDIASRLSDAVKDLSSRTSQEDQKGKKYKRSLENLSSLASTVDSLNLTGDERIKEACQTIKDDICQWSPEAIKTTPMVREGVTEASDSVMEKLSTISI